MVDDLHNTSSLQRRFLGALTGRLGVNGRLIAACEDVDLAPTFGGRDLAAMSVFLFSGGSLNANVDRLLQDCIPDGSFYRRVELTANQRSSYKVQQLAYEILFRHLVGMSPVDRQYIPSLCAFRSISAEARFIANEVESIHLEEASQSSPLSSVRCRTRHKKRAACLQTLLLTDRHHSTA